MARKISAVMIGQLVEKKKTEKKDVKVKVKHGKD